MYILCDPATSLLAHVPKEESAKKLRAAGFVRVRPWQH